MTTDTSIRPAPSPKLIPSLDGLRGLAALAVLWYHFPQVGHSRLAMLIHDVAKKTSIGQFAVDVFLVLSGFLITRIIVREVQQGRFSLRLFLAKRALRIFPIYYLTLLAFAFWEPINGQWTAAACYVSNYTIPFDAAPHPLGHTWSLAVEEQFYLLWPLVFVCFPLTIARQLAWPVGPAVALGAAVLTFSLVEPNLAWGLVYRGLPTRMLSLLLGATFAFHEAAFRTRSANKVAAAGVLSFLFLLATAFGIQQTQWSGFRVAGCLLSATASLLLVQFVVLCDARNGLTRRVLTSSPLLWAGRISYGLYLYHHVILSTVFTPHGLHTRGVVLPISEALLAATLCCGVPLLSYVLIEAPLLRLKSRLPALMGTERLPDADVADSDATPRVMRNPQAA